MAPLIGIDLGTTNSLIAVFENGEPRLIPNASGNLMTPSVVGLDDQGHVVVGEAARSRLPTNPDKTHALFKRTMGAERTYRLGRQQLKSEDLSAIILRNLKEDAENELGEEVKDVVVSVPAYFNELQRRAVKDACAIAELNPIRLINEPTAAAMAYGLHEKDQETTFLIFDLGGGTFDVSVLEIFDGVFEVRASAGDANLGGEDFTRVIAKDFARQLGLEGRELDPDTEARLRKVAEEAKLALSKRDEVTLDVAMPEGARPVSLSRDGLEQMAEPIIARLRRPVERCLHDSNTSLQDIDRVLLVGGATRMTAVRSFAARSFGILPDGRLDPDHVVALGAAVQAAFVAKDEALGDLVMTDVTAFSMGVSSSQELRGKWVDGFYAPVIERNSTVPISREITMQAAEVGQTNMPIAVFQGEAPAVRDNLFLGAFNIALPYNRKDREAVRIRFTYDVSGLLEVEAESLSQGHKESLVIQGGTKTLSEAEVKSRLKHLQSLKVHPRDEQENIAFLARLRENYEMALGPVRESIQRLHGEFEEALMSQDKSIIARKRIAIAQKMQAFEDNYVR